MPSKWVREQGIKKGDEIDIIEEGDKLIIGTGLGSGIKTLNLDTKEFSKATLCRHLRTLYRRGYDKLILKIKNSEQLKEIEEIIRNLIGFEIVEQSKTECVIEDIAESQTKDVNKLINRVIMLMMSMCEELQDETKPLQSEKLKDIILTDTQINKFTDYIIRLINKRIVDRNISKELLYFLAIQMESIGDRCKIAAEKITELNWNKLVLWTWTPSIKTMYKSVKGELEIFNLLKKYSKKQSN